MFRPQKPDKTIEALRALNVSAALLDPYYLPVSNYAIHRNCFEATFLIALEEKKFL